MSTSKDTGNGSPVSAGTPSAYSAASSSTAASPDPDLRSRIVEMLASTLNNGFAELGLFPDHLTTVHAIYEWSQRLRDENVRLFADNRRLAQLIGMQNTRIAVQDGGPSSTTHELHTRIQEIEMSRYDVIRQNEQLAQEVMVLRAEIHRLSQILMSKGMSNELARSAPIMSGPRVMGQQVTPAYHYGPVQAQKARHSQLPPVNTSFSAQSAQSAPVMQAPVLPAYHTYQQPHHMLVPSQSMSHRGTNGPMTTVFYQDPRAIPRVYVKGAKTSSSSSQPSTAPTKTVQTSASIVDLTADSDEEKRSAKKPRIESGPAVATTPVTPSTPQGQVASASPTPADQQVPSADEHTDISLEWLNMDAHVPMEPSEDVRMGSPVQVQAAREVPMDVVQQAQTLLEAPPTPTAEPPQIEDMQQPSQSQSAVGGPSASAGPLLSMQMADQPTQESLKPSPEVIQQCIDENFIPFDSGNGDEGIAEGATSPDPLVCRMCQIRHIRGLSDRAPEVFAVNTSTDDLARHCQQEHPKGWIVLLQRCMEDDESDEDE
ncbi:hypothetical protein C8Q72DRAFT_468491 [Fomitopsis betulina]|nr:hypothetical protein C8Q72DRAFT_468491 [Fomitopsis betulina]